jgi:hypothetical protein
LGRKAFGSETAVVADAREDGRGADRADEDSRQR